MDIDLDSEASKRHLIFQKMKEYWGHDNVLNILTLKTEGSKSTVLTACRGLGILDDIAQSIADMIPFERGSHWALRDCFEGNNDKGRHRIAEFVNKIAEYPQLKEVMLMIEGLVCGRSIHASGVYIFENGYLEQNGRMRAPNGSNVTAFTMYDSDYMGGLKIDCLTVKALDKLHTTVNLLIEANVIEDKGSIKDNYDAYVAPQVLDTEAPEIWDMIAEHSLIDAFQFDTDVGANAGIKVKPTSVEELAVANSLMRLMAEPGQEQPIDTYVRFKNDIQLWYQEMDEWGLTGQEIQILEPHLLSIYGVADTQEVVMQLAMDSNIASFSVAEANILRKAIAKKKPKLLIEVQEMFFTKAREQHTSKELMTYVWDVQIKRQLG